MMNLSFPRQTVLGVGTSLMFSGLMPGCRPPEADSGTMNPNDIEHAEEVWDNQFDSDDTGLTRYKKIEMPGLVPTSSVDTVVNVTPNLGTLNCAQQDVFIRHKSNPLELIPQTLWVCDPIGKAPQLNVAVDEPSSFFQPQQIPGLHSILESESEIGNLDSEATAKLSKSWSDPWSWFKVLGGLTLSVLLYNVVGRVKNKFGEHPVREDWLKQAGRVAFTTAQGAIVAGSVLAALNTLGVDLTAIAAVMSLAVSAIVITLKEFILNGLAYLLLRVANKIKIGDEIEVDGVRGVVKDITWQMVYLEGIDDFGDTMWLTVPPSMFLNRPSKGFDKHPEFVKSIKVGDSVAVYNTHSGRLVKGEVIKISEHAIVVRNYDVNLHEVIQVININDINPDTFQVWSELKPLPNGLKIGDHIRILTPTGVSEGVITTFDDWVFTLAIEDKATGKTWKSIQSIDKLYHGVEVVTD